MSEQSGAETADPTAMPIRYEMRTAEGVIVSMWMVLPGHGGEPSELWRTDLLTGQRHRIRGRWEEV